MPKTLVEKLAEVGAAIPQLQKLGDNGQYTYLRAFDVLGAVRKELFKHEIVIVPEYVESTYEKPFETVTGDIVQEVRVTVQYRVTDGGPDAITGMGIGVGQDYQGKAAYKALTGSLKYFLQAIGLIAGVEDDPETTKDTAAVPEGLAEKLDEAEKKFGPDLREHPISQRDVRAFNAACLSSKRSASERKKYLLSTFHIGAVSELRRRDFKEALDWALGGKLQSDSQDATQEETTSA